MAKVTHVKHAQKDNPVCKKGESYYHWTPFRSAKRYSKEYPRASQLCSGRKSEVMSTQEALEDDLKAAVYDIEAVQAACESAAESFRDQGQEYVDGADNMPENLQYGEQAESMREMGASLESAADELEGMDFDLPNAVDPDDVFTDEEEPDPADYTDDDDYCIALDDYQSALDVWQTEHDDQLAENEAHIDQLIEDAISASENIEFMF